MAVKGLVWTELRNEWKSRAGIEKRSSVNSQSTLLSGSWHVPQSVCHRVICKGNLSWFTVPEAGKSKSITLAPGCHLVRASSCGAAGRITCRERKPEGEEEAVLLCATLVMTNTSPQEVTYSWKVSTNPFKNIEPHETQNTSKSPSTSLYLPW